MLLNEYGNLGKVDPPQSMVDLLPWVDKRRDRSGRTNKVYHTDQPSFLNNS